MSGFQLFYLVILPIGIAAAGWMAVILHERSAPKDRPTPGE